MPFITVEEDAAYVLDDVFLNMNSIQMNAVLSKFFSKFEVLNDWDTNENEMNNYLINKQDDLEDIRDSYLNSI
jgi:hypothetical protein